MDYSLSINKILVLLESINKFLQIDFYFLVLICIIYFGYWFFSRFMRWYFMIIFYDDYVKITLCNNGYYLLLSKF